MVTKLLLIREGVKVISYLPGTGVNHDHEGGSPKVRLAIALR